MLAVCDKRDCRSDRVLEVEQAITCQLTGAINLSDTARDWCIASVEVAMQCEKRK